MARTFELGQISDAGRFTFRVDAERRRAGGLHRNDYTPVRRCHLTWTLPIILTIFLARTAALG